MVYDKVAPAFAQLEATLQNHAMSSTVVGEGLPYHSLVFWMLGGSGLDRLGWICCYYRFTLFRWAPLGVAV